MAQAVEIESRLRGKIGDAYLSQLPELILVGPAGTGKSRGALIKLHDCALDYPSMRGLIARKTRKSLTQSAMKTYADHVLHRSERVHFHTTDQEYRYPNGSVVVVAGLDDPRKALSTDYDLIYIQQTEECSEDDWENLSSRLRNGVMPYQQLLGDCNPWNPAHWIKRRADRGQTPLFETVHRDNPALWTGTEWTPGGAVYIDRLSQLTGVRRLRLFQGMWAAAEGIVYEAWDRAVHLINRFEIPPDWRRVRAIDFGFVNPTVVQWFAVDGDGRAYLYREIYHTGVLNTDLAAQINELSTGERIEATVADHDAEGRAQLEALGIPTIAADKAVSPGIQAVSDRLRPAGDGKPRLFVLRDSVVGIDPVLAAAAKPTCTEAEFEGYVWAQPTEGKALKEAPVKLDDHGMDGLRYAVMYLDGRKPVPIITPFGATQPSKWKDRGMPAEPGRRRGYGN